MGTEGREEPVAHVGDEGMVMMQAHFYLVLAALDEVGVCLGLLQRGHLVVGLLDLGVKPFGKQTQLSFQLLIFRQQSGLRPPLQAALLDTQPDRTPRVERLRPGVGNGRQRPLPGLVQENRLVGPTRGHVSPPRRGEMRTQRLPPRESPWRKASGCGIEGSGVGVGN